jgi:transcriptional antiterminator RfaH
MSSFLRRTLLYRVKLQQYEASALEHAARADWDNGSLAPAFQSHPRWYLIQCKARQDERALHNLQRQGFECYCPVYESERIRRGRKHLTSAALFPGYLFIRLDRVNDNWLPIRSTRGVIQVVRFNEYPLPVEDGIVEQIRRRIEDKPIREPHLKSGERVALTFDGSFSGIEAIFVSSVGEERVMLLLTILQSAQALIVPLESVRRLERKTCLG